jgi:hypothetical protein
MYSYKLEWLGVPVRDMSNKERYGQTALTYGDHLVVLGGIDDRYIGPELYIMILARLKI